MHATARDTMTLSNCSIPDEELDARYERIIAEADERAQAHAARLGSMDNPLGDLCFKVGYLASRLARVEAKIARLESGDLDE